MAVAALRDIRAITMSIAILGIGNGASLFFGARGTPGITPLAAEQQVAMHAESLYIDSISVFVILLYRLMNGSFQND